jgi:hypothetical protein
MAHELSTLATSLPVPRAPAGGSVGQMPRGIDPQIAAQNPVTSIETQRLGPVRVSVESAGEGAVRIAMLVQPAAAMPLESGRMALAEALQAQGLRLDGLSVAVVPIPAFAPVLPPAAGHTPAATAIGESHLLAPADNSAAQNGAQNGTQNSTQNVFQNEAQNEFRNESRNESRNEAIGSRAEQDTGRPGGDAEGRNRREPTLPAAAAWRSVVDDNTLHDAQRGTAPDRFA